MSFEYGSRVRGEEYQERLLSNYVAGVGYQ
jgi:hypothetical protein